jgi:hypothetical protein
MIRRLLALVAVVMVGAVAAPAMQNHRPRVGVSGGDVFVGWTVPTATSARAYVAERSGGTWTATYASPASATALQFLRGLAPGVGRQPL